ncbi:MAG TPA: BrnA antitoxin family protein [Rhizomicrobium sp.]
MTKRKASPFAVDTENPEFTSADFRKAKRIEDIPALAHLSKRKPGERGPQKAPTKEPVSLRLDPYVVNYFRAHGDGWQSEINLVLGKIVIVRKHGNTLVSTLRRAYGSDFAPGVRSDRKLSDILDEVDEGSLRKLRA